jgi:uncharacterized protein YutE (UPF0331/DUF86 family)
MVDKTVILRRVEQIEEHLLKLSKYKKISYKEFVQNTDVQDITEYNFFQTINHIIDIVEHITVDENYGNPESVQDCIPLLVKNKVIDVKTAELLRKMIGLRNFIAHEYISIDKSKIHEIVTKKTEDIRRAVKLLLGKFI